jgi:hypothetical protein
MARRITALLAMVALIVLLLVLLWHVYLHHRYITPGDEPAVVEAAPTARKVLI